MARALMTRATRALIFSISTKGKNENRGEMKTSAAVVAAWLTGNDRWGKSLKGFDPSSLLNPNRSKTSGEPVHPHKARVSSWFEPEPSSHMRLDSAEGSSGPDP
ncbi:hypothetical protein V6N12_011312 [Hibiscus sabdariffa]|uniref:Uncharacterized protein n=1 Tax=Hibiscus sabdariffa TaxID=183260 RepID=A0ABR2B813_9ROSI